MTKICPQCGTEFTVYGTNQNSRKYCSKECYTEANRKLASEPGARIRCRRYDCLYRPQKSADNGCDYFLITGELRNCPPGKDCTCYKHATPAERKARQIKSINSALGGRYYYG